MVSETSRPLGTVSLQPTVTNPPSGDEAASQMVSPTLRTTAVSVVVSPRRSGLARRATSSS